MAPCCPHDYRMRTLRHAVNTPAGFVVEGIHSPQPGESNVEISMYNRRGGAKYGTAGLKYGRMVPTGNYWCTGPDRYTYVLCSRHHIISKNLNQAEHVRVTG
ncbi:unnamed protein product, partial [Sphacelaria rigidula]